MESRCPDCKSDKVIPWSDGYICCSCGCEFGEAAFPEDDQQQ